MSTAVGIILMTFGSAQSADEVEPYLRSVRGGGDPDPQLVEEFRRRYELVGWSPLVEITRAQSVALQNLLYAEDGPGHAVEVGMLHSHPTIDEALSRLHGKGVEVVVGIILSPQYSPIIMGRYGRALSAAAQRIMPETEIRIAGPWHRTTEFIQVVADNVHAALARTSRPDLVPVILTAHSLPEAVVKRDPGYIDQIMETVGLIADRAGLPRDRWQFAYQSAGHTPEEWLKPDLKDLLPGIRAEGHEEVLVVPVQFLADHLEILYDIDIAAREEAEEAGLRFHRIELPNTSPTFIRALAEVARREERARQAAAS
ncbi:MAG TPA: ferrochelatase [Candidatus Dormibacteraeota bacterium]|nr:ferrochelatase [Candidatus Dormibacteraeota bacterium]